MPLLPFISDEDYYKNVKQVLKITNDAMVDSEEKLFSNVIDPFSAVFASSIQKISLEEWFEFEKTRQIQKTMENALGYFHQDMIGSMPGWENLGTGSKVDVKNDETKIFAEIKNKYNTTTGVLQIALYDTIKSCLNEDFKEYNIGYYVCIIRNTIKPFDKPFVPSDHKTHKKRPTNEKIRKIDGSTFYDIASGHENSLKMVYDTLPEVISDIQNMPQNKIIDDEMFHELFKRAYPA